MQCLTTVPHSSEDVTELTNTSISTTVQLLIDFLGVVCC
jgi:hypothetical protein